jgi:autotransporter-associated beta strand protein
MKKNIQLLVTLICFALGAVFPAMGAYELQNGPIEDPFTSGIVSPWTYYSGGSMTGVSQGKETTIIHPGGSTASQRLSGVAANASANMGIRQTIQADQGDAFTFSAWVYKVSAIAQHIASIRVAWDGSTTLPGSDLASTGTRTTWTQIGPSGCAGNATGSGGVTLFLHNRRNTGNGDQRVYWDDVLAYHAYVPAAPTVGNATGTTLDVTVNKNSNDAETHANQYAITIGGGAYTSGSSWVQANGTVGGTAVWQTRATWGTKTVSGLANSTTYNFKVQSRYDDTITQPTDLTASTAASGTTTAGSTTLDWASGNGTWATGRSDSLWKNDIGGAAADYADGNAVQFLDTYISSSPTITLDTTVTPSSVYASHSTYDYTITGSGAIGGSIGLTKLGSGTLTMGVANTYSGTTAIGAGVLVANKDDGTGNGPLGNGGTISFSGGTLQYSSANQVDYSSRFTASQPYKVDTAGQSVTWNTALSGSGGTLTKSGAGTLTLGGNNSYTGDTTISAGTLKLGAAERIPHGTGNGNVTVSGTLDLDGFSENINGLSGAGTVDSTAAGTPTLTVGNNNASSSFSGVIQNTAGTLALTKVGTGTLTWSPGATANTYSGTTTISAGTVTMGNGGVLPSGSGAGNIVINGTLDLGAGYAQQVNGISGNGTVTCLSTSVDPSITIGNNGASSTFDGLISNGNIISGAHGVAVAKVGAGTIRISNTANTFKAVCDVREGILEITSVANKDSNSSIGTGGKSTADARIGLGLAGTTGTLRYTGTGHSSNRDFYGWGAYADSGGGAVIDASGSGPLTLSGQFVQGVTMTANKTLTLTGDNTGANAFNGVINDGTGGFKNRLVKAGGGKWVLGAANLYTGGTTVSGGTLEIGASGSVKGNVTITGSVLKLDNASALQSTATLTLPASPSAGTVDLNFSGTQTINALYFDGAQQDQGTWGGASSTADHKNAAFNSTSTGILLVTTGNHTPVAPAAKTLTTPKDTAATFAKVKLLAGASDADPGDTLTVSAAGPGSAQGGTVVLETADVKYTPPAGYTGPDSYTYSISDGHSTVLGTVNVTVTETNGASPNVVVPATYSGGTFRVTFAGIPGYEYTVQYAESPTGPWSYLKKATAGADGLFEVVDEPLPETPARYYRTVYP